MTGTSNVPWRTLSPLYLGFFVVIASANVMSVATVDVASTLHVGLGAAVWTTTGYLIPLAALLMIGGRLGDRYGYRRVYIAGVVAFLLGSVLAAMAPSLPVLIFGRVIQGIGAGVMSPQPLAIITTTVTRASRGTALGIWGATSGLALLLGPLLGGLLLAVSSWRSIFVVTAVLTVVVLILSAAVLPRNKHTAGPLDLPGATLSAAGITFLVAGAQQATAATGSTTGPIIAIAVGISLLAVFAVVERRAGDSALMPMSVLRDRSFISSGIGVAAAGFAISAIGLPIILWAQRGHGSTELGSAALIAPMALTTVIAAPIIGRHLTEARTRAFIANGFVLLAASIAVAAVLTAAGVRPPWLLIPAAVLGAGAGMLWGPLASNSTTSIPVELVGAASGLYNGLRQVGGAVGVSLVTLALQPSLANLPDTGTATHDALQQFDTATGISLLLPLAAAIGALVFTIRQPKTPPTPR
jgi:EmrB/QacA subfamily drug resistance transporter